ncbi:glycoside hydrolase family 3 protein [Pseudomonas folii]|uniref:beta-glucosidase n=1 Tax=Pseudomonas folii TaxID=2762593 RepID=A0ABR7AY47_9PSED|nr:glycoside hydrolase family 3 N-terminal domain-containing protein [Pseudomonas folii]MBC3949848.1 glycoside hydrolase family 3 C-terminal domain-containing protein [Pseudomonas folii]
MKKSISSTAAVVVASCYMSACSNSIATAPHVIQPVLKTVSSPLLHQDGQTFKDLDHNGVLDAYEDWRLTPEARTSDLVQRMTLEEKIGLMMHSTAPYVATGADAGYNLAKLSPLIGDKHINHFISRLSITPVEMVSSYNQLQGLAEKTRLGIPISFSTDPRNHFQYTLGASVSSGSFSQWPETLGLAATGDEKLVERFGDVARQEYRAMGIQIALSPQADLATEPRWSRINGTFGEDVGLVSKMTAAYIVGFQHGTRGLQPDGVAATVKHWAGYGAAHKGFDAMNAYGRDLAYSAEDFKTQLSPFKAAFAVNAAETIPTYGVPPEGVTVNGKPLERVGASFSKQMLTDLLRNEYGFKGIILTDWLITNSCTDECLTGSKPGEDPNKAYPKYGMPWGVEGLTEKQRFIKAVDAGVDQFGGTFNTEPLIEAVKEGALAEARIDESVSRLLLQKFQLGLFETPYADATEAERVVGNAQFKEEGLEAQRRSLVMLQNKQNVLPLKPGAKVYLVGVSNTQAQQHGLTVVSAPEDADVALVRMSAPFETHATYAFGSGLHEGDLDFKQDNAEYKELLKISAKVPVVTTVYLDRPAVLSNVAKASHALVANFGVSDQALLDVLTGKHSPEGKLPFELPSSMAAVEAQQSGKAADSNSPLYPVHFGLKY